MILGRALGHHREQSDERCEYLALSFSPLSAPLRSRWRNNGVSADFLGDYVTTFLPGGVGAAAGDTSEIRQAVTYIANEFLENAMKYHERNADIPIGIRLELTREYITVSATNGISPEQAERYEAFVGEVLGNDASDLLHRQLEKSAADIESKTSCLGLLTMITDYSAEMGWRFDTPSETSGTMVVTTSAVLSLRNFGGFRP
jgi:hypothetical protein